MAQSASQAITGNNSFDDSKIRISSEEGLSELPFGINTVIVKSNIVIQTGPSSQVVIKFGSYLVLSYHCDDDHQNKLFYYLGFDRIYWIQNYQGEITAKQLV